MSLCCLRIHKLQSRLHPCCTHLQLQCSTQFKKKSFSLTVLMQNLWPRLQSQLSEACLSQCRVQTESPISPDPSLFCTGSWFFRVQCACTDGKCCSLLPTSPHRFATQQYYIFVFFLKSDHCLSVWLSVLSCPVSNVCVLWPNGRTDQDETWHAGRPRPWPHCVRWGLRSLPHRGTATPPPIFGPYLLWQNGSTDQDATWHGGRPRPRRHCVRWGPSSLPKRGQSPLQFSAHVYCGQTATWIKMPLGWRLVQWLASFVAWTKLPCLGPG